MKQISDLFRYLCQVNTNSNTCMAVHSHPVWTTILGKFDWNPKNPAWQRPQRQPSLTPIGQSLLQFSQLMTQLLELPPPSYTLKHNVHAGMWAAK